MKREHTAKRLEELRGSIEKSDLDGFVIYSYENSDSSNLRYMTNFDCSLGVMIITEGESLFLTDSRYYDEASEAIENYDLIKIEKDPLETAASKVKQIKGQKFGISESDISLSAFNKLKKLMEQGSKNLKPVPNPVKELRTIKDESEIERQKKAGNLTDATVEHILGKAKPGVTEKELALEIEIFMRKNGAEDVAFDPIVASGEKSAYPHATATNKEIEKGEFLLIDMGAKVNGYCADLTRTFHIGEANSKKRKIYNLVLEAHKRGLEALHDSATAKKVDRAARKVIEDAGYGQNFGHRLGHGVGLEIHEAPELSSESEKPLKKGMVVTVEPGIYIPQWGGIRIEDMVQITAEGYSSFSKADKEELIEI